MADYKTPGVYIVEESKFPPSIAEVETAIPIFIGFTEKARLKEDGDLLNEPKRITSLLEYENFFGKAQNEDGITVTVDGTDIQAKITSPSPFQMFYSMQAFFINGGGPCYILSVGGFTGNIDLAVLSTALPIAEKIDEVTLILFPDGQGISTAGDYYALLKEAMDQCTKLKDRFAVMDVWIDSDTTVNNIDVLRAADFGTVETSKYGAVYYPKLEMRFDYQYADADVTVDDNGSASDLDSLKGSNNALYNQAKSAINQIPLILSPSAPVVGVYANVDDSRGVWKAPANVNIDFAIKPTIKITDEEQESLNVDSTAGKSINAIRSFTGRGPAIIWGARTLAGNDNEWRYVSVRRFFNMVEESVKKATFQFVFEPNDVNTWTRVKSMIENFLTLQWKAGALMGTTPEQAYYVKVGLNETMTELDIWEGRMIVEIGMVAVRPAEFIILVFSHKMLEES